MYCPNCGKQIERSKYCRFCGKETGIDENVLKSITPKQSDADPGMHNNKADVSGDVYAEMDIGRESGLFGNVGGAIKSLVKICFCIGVVVSIIVGIAIIVMFKAGETDGRFMVVVVVATIILIIIGAFVSWLLSLVVYGYGELVENSAVIRKNTEMIKMQIVSGTKTQNRENDNAANTVSKKTSSDNIIDKAVDYIDYNWVGSSDEAGKILISIISAIVVIIIGIWIIN